MRWRRFWKEPNLIFIVCYCLFHVHFGVNIIWPPFTKMMMMMTTTVIHVIKSNIWPLPGYSLLQDLKRKCKKKKKILKPPDVAVIICITDYIHMSPREISLIFLPKYLLLLTDCINVRTSCKTLYMMCKMCIFNASLSLNNFFLSVG